MFRYRADQHLQVGLLAAALLMAAIVGLIVLFIFREALPVLSDRGLMKFLQDESWHPLENQFGMLPMLWGTLACTVGAIALAAPLGVASALFCRFYAPPALARPYRWVLSLLAGIPSVVFGFWGLTVLVPLIASWQPPGASLLAGILILALMTLPTVALTSEAALTAVPASYISGAQALGLSQKTTLLRVILPAARHGLIAGLILAAARALGETMALLMVTGNVVATPNSLFAPIRALTANIALEMAYAMQFHRASLFVSGLMLMAAVAGLVLLARQLERRLALG
ncbi:MAG: phosphate ABC transporter permease subunit PstC [Betaproteobacteria bacterium]|nr:phosphate ABC transporter permease subunit PstC [Betaproteobacteria bacterium]